MKESKWKTMFRRSRAGVSTWLLACCVLGTSLMGGCQPQQDEASSTPVETSGDTEVSQELVKSALKFTPDENLDLGGKTLTISVWGEPAPEGIDPYMDRRYTLEKRTEEKYKVNIEWKATNIGTFVQDVSLAFSSRQNYADLMFAPSYHGFDVARLGAAMPLDDYIDYSSPFYQIANQTGLYVDGKHYTYFPDDYSTNSLGYFVVYNETLLEAANCEMPMDLYKRGEWDWDAFAEIVQKTTVLKDGEVTQFGIGGSNLLEALCLSNGFSAIHMDTQSQKFTCGLYTDAGTNVLNFLRKLAYEYKGCDSQFGGHNSKITFEDGRLAMIISPAYYPGSFIAKGMDIYSVPLPKGPDATGNVNGLEMAEWWLASSLSDFEPEHLIQVALDMNENDPAFEDTYFSQEGKKDNFVARLYDGGSVGTEEEAEFFFDFITSPDVKSILNITTTDITATLAANVSVPISNGEDPRSVLERIQPVIDTALNDMLPENLKQ